MSERLKQAALALGLGVAVLLSAKPTWAAGIMEWGTAAESVTTEGGGAGYALVGLAIILVGIALAFAWHSILTFAISLTLGGALAANYDAIRTFLFPGGAAGGSISDVTVAVPIDPAFIWTAQQVPSDQPNQPDQPAQPRPLDPAPVG
jgi:hypothetical protein